MPKQNDRVYDKDRRVYQRYHLGRWEDLITEDVLIDFMNNASVEEKTPEVDILTERMKGE